MQKRERRVSEEQHVVADQFALPSLIFFVFLRNSKVDTPYMTSIQIEENVQSSLTSETSYASCRATDGGTDPDTVSSAEPSDRDGLQALAPPPSSQRSGSKRSERAVRYSEPLQFAYDAESGELNIQKEKRSQKYLMVMVIVFAICWCPLKILILVTHFVYETDHNASHFDVTFLTFTFFGFLSTCANPVLFASWQMSNRTRDRLRGYFRFSNRRRSSARSCVSRSTEIYAPPPQTPSPRPSPAQHALTVPKSYV